MAIMIPGEDGPVADVALRDRGRTTSVLVVLVVMVVAGAAGWLLGDRVGLDPAAVPVGHVSDFAAGSVTEVILDVGHYDPMGVEGPTQDATGGRLVASTRLFVVNHADLGLLALSQRSPWLGCRVIAVTAEEASGYHQTLPAGFERGFLDPCHGGLFSLAGQHLAGPGEASLAQFPIRYLPDATVVIDVTDVRSG